MHDPSRPNKNYHVSDDSSSPNENGPSIGSTENTHDGIDKPIFVIDSAPVVSPIPDACGPALDYPSPGSAAYSHGDAIPSTETVNEPVGNTERKANVRKNRLSGMIDRVQWLGKPYWNELLWRAGWLGKRYWGVLVLAWRDRKNLIPPTLSKDERDFLPAALEVQESPPSPLPVAVLKCICLSLFILFLWSVFSRMDIVAIAPGQIIATEAVRSINAPEPGTIVSIDAREGQSVKSGQILFTYRPRNDRDIFGSDSEQAKIEEKPALEKHSPIDGVVYQLSLSSPGEVVGPAQILMMILPNDCELLLEAALNNRDIGFVRPGQTVLVKVDPYPYTTYGHIEGTVIMVTAKSNEALLAREVQIRKGLYEANLSLHQRQHAPPAELLRTELEYNQARQRQVNYLDEVQAGKSRSRFQCLVRIPHPFITRGDQRLMALPGMQATAEIRTGDRRVISYFLGPLSEHLHEDMRER